MRLSDFSCDVRSNDHDFITEYANSCRIAQAMKIVGYIIAAEK
jgi:hypothetical protein